MKKTESNPFRPYTPARKYTVCKIVLNSNLSNWNVGFAHVDADPNPEFESWLLNYCLPESHLHFDKIMEVWFVEEEHVTAILNKAKEHFDHIHFQDKNGELHTYKT